MGPERDSKHASLPPQQWCLSFIVHQHYLGGLVNMQDLGLQPQVL